MGAETAANFNHKADTIELDHFAGRSVHQLASLISSDALGDAVIALGHQDSITLPGVSANHLLAHLQPGASRPDAPLFVIASQRARRSGQPDDKLRETIQTGAGWIVSRQT